MGVGRPPRDPPGPRRRRIPVFPVVVADSVPLAGTFVYAWRYRERRTRGGAMTTLTYRALGPDKKAAEMSDSDDAGHANRAIVTAAKADGTQVPAGPLSFADRRRQHAWVPVSVALLTALIGLS